MSYDTLVNKGLQVISKLYEGKRNYELTNHLGNVLAVINDRKTDSLNGTTKIGFNAVVISATDYFPFGMAIDSRSYTSSLYRYGFNGKELDKETGEQDYGMRIYDPRIAKFLSVDPIAIQYPALSPYIFAGNNPIKFIDLDGAEPWYDNKTQKARPPVIEKTNDGYILKAYGAYVYVSDEKGVKKYEKDYEFIDKNVGINKESKFIGGFTSHDLYKVIAANTINRSVRTKLQEERNSIKKAYRDLDATEVCAYDCISMVIAGLSIAYGYDIKFRGTDKDKSMGSLLENMTKAGYAGSEMKVRKGESFKAALTKSVEGRPGIHFFGGALNGSDHSILIAVDNLNDNGTEAGSTIKFYLFDQTKWTGRVDNIDKELSDWSNSAPFSESGSIIREVFKKANNANDKKKK